ncbi:MAG: methylmalonyl-CoA epimerase [Chitinophagales bacterium]
MKKIEHIGIAVKDIDASNELYTKMLNTSPYKQEEVASEFVKTSFFKTGQSKIELLQATDEKSAIHKFVERKGEGIHHIAFAVEDIEEEVARLIAEGFQPLMDKPKKGADNKLVFFFHPKTTGGLLLELCQEIK